MAEHDTLVFLLSLAALLASARLLGEAARWLGMPLVVGEIAAGIVLGPTVLGRIAPDARAWLFPAGAPQTMIGGYTTIAVVLPGTKPVSTAAGETVSTRISGPSTRASERAIVSSAAFDPP